jgi:hypothetical protein
MVLNRNIRQRNSLCDLRSLTDVRQVQIVLCEHGPANSGNGEVTNKQLKSNGFHRFADYPSQIFDTPLPDISGISALPVKGRKANVFSPTNEKRRLYENKSSRFGRLVARYYPANTSPLNSRCQDKDSARPVKPACRRSAVKAAASPDQL